MRSIRRIVHTLKGDAAACGFRELSNAAHALEDALATEVSSSHDRLAEVAFAAADTFGAMLTAYQRKTKLPSTVALAKMIRLAANPSRAIWCARITAEESGTKQSRPEKATPCPRIEVTDFDITNFKKRRRQEQENEERKVKTEPSSTSPSKTTRPEKEDLTPDVAAAILELESIPKLDHTEPYSSRHYRAEPAAWSALPWTEYEKLAVETDSRTGRMYSRSLPPSTRLPDADCSAATGSERLEASAEVSGNQARPGIT